MLKAFKYSICFSLLVLGLGLSLLFFRGGIVNGAISFSTYGVTKSTEFFFYSIFLVALVVPLVPALIGVKKGSVYARLAGLYLALWPCLVLILVAPYRPGTLSGDVHIVATRTAVFVMCSYLVRSLIEKRTTGRVVGFLFGLAGFVIVVLSIKELSVFRLMGLGEYLLIMSFLVSMFLDTARTQKNITP